ncbi:MAG: hypothetical protein K6A28_00125, partial [Bacteroidales bacterium]|nr:hypothetical protein [Bacteroidales bacterium]
FHLYDHSLHQELELTCESTETFATDAMYGIATSPYVLNFVSVINIYTVSVTANPAAGGAVTGAGSFNQGSTATVTATPADGYVFISWTYDGEVVSSDASYSFVVTEDRTLVANFDLNSYTVSVLANPETGGSITGAGAFAHGSTATLTATAATGYSFLNWTEEGEVVSTNATYSFTVTEDRTLVANFSLNSYVINASATPTEGGAVTGIGTFNYGTIVTLTATAATGYTFLNWTEEGEVVSTDATYSFTVTDNRTLMANFTTEAYNVTVSIDPAEGGSVTGDGAYAYGSTATLTAQAAAGYDFVNWTENGEVVSTDATLSFMVTEDKSFTAHFTYVGITYHWSPNSSPYSSTATMIGIIQIDGEEQRLNTLEVGVFCGDECRGREMSMYVPQLDRYILFLTIFGNNGDEVVFRLYDHSLHQESELTCESTETFATDAMYGTATSPYVLNFVSASETTQTITLGSGWTWFSSYIEYSDASLGQLQTGIAANSTTAMIKGQTEFTSFGSGNWSGGLTNLNNESMYLISSNGGEITLTGSLADPTAHPITLTNGWSWIGFLSDTPMSIDEAMSSITPSVNDMVKSQDGFTTFDGSKWTGGLTTLVPGQGYLYLHNGEPIILTYPSPSK